MLPFFNQRIVQPSIEAMAKTLQDGSKSQASKDNGMLAGSTPLMSSAQEGKQLSIINNDGSSLTSWRSEDLKIKSENEFDNEVHHTGRLRKCHSVENGFYLEGNLYADNLTEDYTDPVSIFDCRMDKDANPADKGTKNYSEIYVRSDLGNNGPLFTIGDPTPLDKDALENSDSPLISVCAGEDHTSGPSTPRMQKSRSFPNFMASTLSSGIDSFERAAPLSRSSGDLQVLSMKLKGKGIDESDNQVSRDNMRKTEENHMDGSFEDGYNGHPLSGLARDWVMPATNDISATITLEGESSTQHLDDLPNKDFRIKRINDWVTGLEHCGPLEETNESSDFVDSSNEHFISTPDSVSAARVDGNVTPGMEAAKKYISSLSPNATAAHLTNYGLVVIPLLSVFTSLKVLNVSGNAIGK